MQIARHKRCLKFCGKDFVLSTILMAKEALIKCAPLMVRQGSPESIEGLTTNGINMLPFVLSLSKDLFSVSLTDSLPSAAIR